MSMHQSTDTAPATAPRQVGGKELDSGLYVCGWLKRGPNGIIGTNLMDAEDTVVSMLEDMPRLRNASVISSMDGAGTTGQAQSGTEEQPTSAPVRQVPSESAEQVLTAGIEAGRLSGQGEGSGSGLKGLLQARGVRVVDFADWEVLDAAEIAAGQVAGRVREKAVDVAVMIAMCDQSRAMSLR